ncbi:MAG: indole-3-glycerol phosphate synthase TrpC [Lentisphaeria bacterium]|jgi:indole-3-glycerol phosphate synthase
MTILDQIITRTRADLATAKQRLPEGQLRQRALGRERPRDFRGALQGRPGDPARVIAELKKASPSKGLIRADFGVVSLARELELAGAAALSVLTEPHWFQGSPAYLQAVADSVTIPVLRKDFIVDPYQIFEARAWGAAAVLLIAAALPPAEFAALAKLAGELELAVLAEVHDREELDWVLTCGVEIVGINARDLRTFKTDLAVAESLLQALPPGIVGVAESAIRDRADLRRLQAAGAGAFLIGETLMRADHPGAKLAELLG